IGRSGPLVGVALCRAHGAVEIEFPFATFPEQGTGGISTSPPITRSPGATSGIRARDAFLPSPAAVACLVHDLLYGYFFHRPGGLHERASKSRACASGPEAEPSALRVRARRKVSIGQPCCNSRDAATAASRALVSTAVPCFAVFSKISARRPSLNLPT